MFKGYFKPALLAVTDFVLLSLSFTLSCHLVRSVPEWPISLWFQNLIWIVVVQLIIFFKFGLYKAVLRYASIDFLVTVLKAVFVASISVMIVFYVAEIKFSLSTVFVCWLLNVFFIGGSRFLVRYYFELKLRFQKGRRVLIYGAGDMGSLALRQLLMNKAILYSPIGFLDDDVKKHGSVLHGVKVLGSPEDLEEIVDQYHVEDVVVAIAELESDHLNSVVRRLRQKGIVCRIIPCFSRLLAIEPEIRNIELADLMRRTPRDLDKESIKRYLQGKKVLITGAAGSIGSELVRQSLQYFPEIVLALDQSEYGLYALREELGKLNVGVEYILGDVTNTRFVENIFKTYLPEIVFHAAAYKHVPLLETNMIEGVRNNVLGAKNLCELSDKYKVESFVMISTDKAVKPSSIMGATKRICELMIQNFDIRSKTEFVAVRFGNVLGSSGSVVPKFIEQIKKGGPVTVTHPDTTRYFMLIDEAVQLVLQAAAMGKGGEIFILDMGKPVKIIDMAEDLIYLMGRQPHKDIKIEYSGMRPGEKIHEELFNDEKEEPTKFKGITIGRSEVLDWDWLSGEISALLQSSVSEDGNNLIKIMKELVPEGTFEKINVKVPNQHQSLCEETYGAIQQ